MLRSIKDLKGYIIKATDGTLGSVSEFYFDDYTWAIRYLVVNTGGWLIRHEVLLSPLVLGQPDWENRSLPVNLTKDQVDNSPEVYTDLPVSRQQEVALHNYFGWNFYWNHFNSPPPTLTQQQFLTAELIEKAKEKDQKSQDKHLRSTNEVINYSIHATDGHIGHVEDFIVDDETWLIQYMIVDTRNWLPGKKVLIAPYWIQTIDWIQSEVVVDLSQESIKNAPEFNPTAPINRQYEAKLYDYYGRPKYWETK